MKESLFGRCMGNAAVILFAVSLLVFVVGLGTSWAMFGGVPANNTPTGDRLFGLATLFGYIVNALGSAAFPFFGAALLVRIDRWLDMPK